MRQICTTFRVQHVYKRVALQTEEGQRNSSLLLSTHLCRMSSKLLTLAFIALALSLGTHAGTGPVTDLRIVNKDIAPDGFMRPTVLAGGTFPGALITGQKVRYISTIFVTITNDQLCRETTSKSMSSTSLPMTEC